MYQPNGPRCNTNLAQPATLPLELPVSCRFLQLAPQMQHLHPPAATQWYLCLNAHHVCNRLAVADATQGPSWVSWVDPWLFRYQCTCWYSFRQAKVSPTADVTKPIRQSPYDRICSLHVPMHATGLRMPDLNNAQAGRDYRQLGVLAVPCKTVQAGQSSYPATGTCQELHAVSALLNKTMRAVFNCLPAPGARWVASLSPSSLSSLGVPLPPAEGAVSAS